MSALEIYWLWFKSRFKNKRSIGTLLMFTFMPPGFKSSWKNVTRVYNSPALDFGSLLLILSGSDILLGCEPKSQSHMAKLHVGHFASKNRKEEVQLENKLSLSFHHDQIQGNHRYVFRCSASKGKCVCEHDRSQSALCIHLNSQQCHLWKKVSLFTPDLGRENLQHEGCV